VGPLRSLFAFFNGYGFLRRGADAISLLDEVPRCRIGGGGGVLCRIKAL